jgi:hypothetical protein
MRLIDNIKDFTADLEDYVKLKDQEIALIQATSEKMAGIANEVISAKDQEIEQLKAVNEVLKNRLTELAVKVDDAMKFVDQVRIVLFDVVSMYKELEAANDTSRTD